jgi:hypothetical protein
VDILKNLNLGLRFVLEICLIVALAYSGLHISQNSMLKWILCLLLPVLAATIWGRYIAPRASHPLKRPVRLAVELLLFGSAIVLLYLVGQKAAAAVFAISVVVNELLILVWRQ